MWVIFFYYKHTAYKEHNIKAENVQKFMHILAYSESDIPFKL